MYSTVCFASLTLVYITPVSYSQGSPPSPKKGKLYY